MSDRMQQEIEEILGKYKKFPLREPFWRRMRRRLSRWLSSVSQWSASHLPRITVARVMLVAFIFALRRRPRYVEKRWRGQSIELHEPGVSQRLRSWWGRWRSRGRTHR